MYTYRLRLHPGDGTGPVRTVSMRFPGQDVHYRAWRWFGVLSAGVQVAPSCGRFRAEVTDR